MRAVQKTQAISHALCFIPLCVLFLRKQKPLLSPPIKKRGQKNRKKRHFALDFYSVVNSLTQFDTVLIFGNPAIERGVLLLFFSFAGVHLLSHATARLHHLALSSKCATAVFVERFQPENQPDTHAQATGTSETIHSTAVAKVKSCTISTAKFAAITIKTTDVIARRFFISLRTESADGAIKCSPFVPTGYVSCKTEKDLYLIVLHRRIATSWCLSKYGTSPVSAPLRV